MYTVESIENFSQWQSLARTFIHNRIHPSDILWNDQSQQSLWSNPDLLTPVQNFSVSKQFHTLAKTAACHNDYTKWDLLYRILYRLQFEKKQLLQLRHDPDVKKLFLLAKSVSRDCHKMKAFVRFKELQGDPKVYVSWYEPDHFILERISYFFKDRFANMHWAILTPYKSMAWDTKSLIWGGPGNKKACARLSDQTEELWDIFYFSIFNPNRLKIKMMKSEMPVRFWKNLPESKNIQRLIKTAQNESLKMIEKSKVNSPNSPTITLEE